MSKLRETFKNIKEPTGSSDYSKGGIVSTIIEGVRAGGTALKTAVEGFTEWSGLDAKDWKDIWLSLGANPESADDATVQALLTAMGLDRATTKADDSVVPTITKLDGFASSNPQTRASLQKVDSSSQRFVGEKDVNGGNVNTRKIAQINEILGEGAFTQAPEGPRVGRNINIGQ